MPKRTAPGKPTAAQKNRARHDAQLRTQQAFKAQRPARQEMPAPARATEPPAAPAVQLTAPAETQSHPRLSVGSSDTDPGDADLTISVGNPGDRLPRYAQTRLGQTDARFGDGFCEHAPGTVSVGAYATSRGAGGMTRGMIKAAARRAAEILDAGGRVHVNCGTGRVRSVSIAALILAHLEPDLDGPALLQRLVNLRPAALGGLEGNENTLTLLEPLHYDLEIRGDYDLSSVRNLRWL